MPSDVSSRVGMFDRFAGLAAHLASRAAFFLFCVLLVVVWFPSIVLIRNVDTWQLIINTATTIITFLMVFLIQNTQNRDAKAIHLKLDELIRAVTGARTHLVDLENLTDEELNRLEREFRRIHEREKRKAEMPAGASANGKH